MTASTKRRRLPAEVPVLGADDFCKGELKDNGRCCMVGWAGLVFAGLSGDSFEYRNDDDVWQKVPVSVRRALVDTVPKSKRRLLSIEEAIDGNSGEITFINDDEGTTKRLLARWWNRATASLGYVVGNPEA